MLAVTITDMNFTFLQMKYRLRKPASSQA